MVPFVSKGRDRKGDKVATGLKETNGGQCLLLGTIGPNLVISRKVITVNTTLIQKLTFHKQFPEGSFWQHLFPEEAKRSLKQNPDAFHRTFTLL